MVTFDNQNKAMRALERQLDRTMMNTSESHLLNNSNSESRESKVLYSTLRKSPIIKLNNPYITSSEALNQSLSTESIEEIPVKKITID